jgi:hypothetical protein
VSSQVLPTDRYGAPAPWRRRALITTSVVVLLAFGGWLVWATVSEATPDVESELIGSDTVDEHSSTAEIRVAFGSDDVVATCKLRAYAKDGTLVGELTFTADPDTGTRYEQTVRTERLPAYVELVGCTTPDQARPR